MDSSNFRQKGAMIFAPGFPPFEEGALLRRIAAFAKAEALSELLKETGKNILATSLHFISSVLRIMPFLPGLTLGVGAIGDRRPLFEELERRSLLPLPSRGERDDSPLAPNRDPE
mmetsp:Transcript_5173/g.8979  ORF Transcript_5173/g.8979 Transcript_5173/m.8979 type:complete len:115 (+) Transcript_5173:170-514(+)